MSSTGVSKNREEKTKPAKPAKIAKSDNSDKSAPTKPAKRVMRREMKKRDPRQFPTQAELRRGCLAGGVRRVASSTYNHMREQIHAYARDVLRKSYQNAEMNKRNTIRPEDFTK